MHILYKIVKSWLRLSLYVVLVLTIVLIKAKNGWNHSFFDEKLVTNPTTPDSVYMKTIKMPKEIQLSLDGYFEIIPELPSEVSGKVSLSWQSTDNSVAFVDDQGVVFAQGKAGQCEVTVTVKDNPDISATTQVIVSNTNDRTTNQEEAINQ